MLYVYHGEKHGIYFLKTGGTLHIFILIDVRCFEMRHYILYILYIFLKYSQRLNRLHIVFNTYNTIIILT